jgi:hypothetical protein
VAAVSAAKADAEYPTVMDNAEMPASSAGLKRRVINNPLILFIDACRMLHPWRFSPDDYIF